MHVIGHEAISDERNRVKAEMLLQEFKVNGFLRVGGEEELAGVSALGDMVRDVGECDTCKAWPRRRISGNAPSVPRFPPLCT
jgi:hypothetical protein